MKTKMMIGAMMMTIGMLQAATYDLKLFQASNVNGTTLKPGEYRMSIDGDKITIQQGKTKVETNGKMETADQKFQSTSVRYVNADGANKVQEIRVGGTNKKVVLF